MPGRSSEGSLLTTGALFLAALCWGLAPVATRYLLASFSPLQLVVLRFSIASLLLLPLLLPLRHHRWTAKEVIWTLFCGATGVIGYNVPVAYGLRVLPSGIAGLLIATEPIWILLIAALVLHERISWSVLLGLLLSLAGIVLLLGQETLGSTGNADFIIGALLVLLAALMWSIYTVSVRSLSKKLGARTSTALTLVTGTLPLLALAPDPRRLVCVRPFSVRQHRRRNHPLELRRRPHGEFAGGPLSLPRTARQCGWGRAFPA